MDGKYHNLKPFRDEGRTYRLRQWMNVAFILAGILGVVLYYAYSQSVGLYVVGGACILKFIELTLRLMKL